MRDKGSGIQIKTSVVSASLQARATLAHSECHTDWYQMTKQPFVFMQQRRGTTYQQNSGFNWNLLFAFLLDYIYTSTKSNVIGSMYIFYRPWKNESK